MAEDLFGNALPEEDADLPVDDEAATDDATEQGQSNPDTAAEATADPEEPLAADGDSPQDPSEAQKYWQAAYTKSRQKDRERYGKLEGEHKQMGETFRRFYSDETYARQVLVQRFPHLASALEGSTPSGQAALPAAPTTAQTTGQLTAELQQSLGEFGFLAQALGPVLERVIESRVNARVQPLEQRTTQQTEAARRTEEERLLAAMDGKYPGWEDTYGAEMKAIDEFLASDRLEHPKYGNKYELYYKLLNPDASRLAATRQMLDAAKRRTSLSRTSHQTVSNIADQVRKAESNIDAFQLAAKAALGGGR